MSGINFDKYSDNEFFGLFLQATKETYSEYCELKATDEGLSGYSEPVFEGALIEFEKRINQLRQQVEQLTQRAQQEHNK